RAAGLVPVALDVAGERIVVAIFRAALRPGAAAIDERRRIGRKPGIGDRPGAGHAGVSAWHQRIGLGLRQVEGEGRLRLADQVKDRAPADGEQNDHPAMPAFAAKNLCAQPVAPLHGAKLSARGLTHSCALFPAARPSPRPNLSQPGSGSGQVRPYRGLTAACKIVLDLVNSDAGEDAYGPIRGGFGGSGAGRDASRWSGLGWR